MKGIVLGYDEENKTGHISSDDTRFSFSINDWLGGTAPKSGMEVDFLKNNDSAIEIYITSTPQEIVSQIPTSNVKKLYYAYLAGAIIPAVYIIAVFFSYSYKEHAEQDDVTHYEYQIKTFWRTIIYQIISLTIYFRSDASFLGLILFVFAIFFYIVRNVKGMTAFDSNAVLDIYWMDFFSPRFWDGDAKANLPSEELDAQTEELDAQTEELDRKGIAVIKFLLVVFIIALLIIYLLSLR